MRSDVQLLQRVVRLNGAVIGVWDTSGRYQPRAGAEKPYCTERTRRIRASDRFWSKQRNIADLLRVSFPPMPDSRIDQAIDRHLEQLACPALMVRTGPNGPIWEQV
jgi:hypothetical protein